MIKFILFVVIVVLIFFAGIRIFERQSIFFPRREMAETPQAVGMSYQDVGFTTADGARLHGWYIPHAGASRTVLFCHGNAGNISYRLDKLSMLYDLGVNIFIFDYRGYGKSEGAPSEKGLYADTQAAYSVLTREKKAAPASIVLYGESIGGACAIDLAAREKVGAVILEGTFTSVSDMAAAYYPFVPAFALASKFDSVRFIAELSCPKLIIQSIDDEIVPFALGQRLYDAAKEPKRFLKLHGGHNTAFLDSKEEYITGITSFLESL